MRKLASLTCISAMALLSACATPDTGYYDKNGNWVAYNRYSDAHNHAPLPGGAANASNDDARGQRVVTTTTTYSYDRAGYYDYNGYYIEPGSSFSVPQEFFPPRGMCRVWFPQRVPADQPAIESCNGIRSRVPAGAYVIYGG